MVKTITDLEPCNFFSWRKIGYNIYDSPLHLIEMPKKSVDQARQNKGENMREVWNDTRLHVIHVKLYWVVIKKWKQTNKLSLCYYSIYCRHVSLICNDQINETNTFCAFSRTPCFKLCKGVSLVSNYSHLWRRKKESYSRTMFSK